MNDKLKILQLLSSAQADELRLIHLFIVYMTIDANTNITERKLTLLLQPLLQPHEVEEALKGLKYMELLNCWRNDKVEHLVVHLSVKQSPDFLTKVYTDFPDLEPFSAPTLKKG